MPRTIAPAAFSLATSAESSLGIDSCSAIEPPVVGRPLHVDRVVEQHRDAVQRPARALPRPLAVERLRLARPRRCSRERTAWMRRALGVRQRDPREVRPGQRLRRAASRRSSAPAGSWPTRSPARSGSVGARADQRHQRRRSPGCSRRARRTAAPGPSSAQRYMLGFSSETGLRSFVPCSITYATPIRSRSV